MIGRKPMRSALLLPVLVGTLAVACGDAPPPPAVTAPVSEPDGARGETQETPSPLDNLAAIGYAEFGEEDESGGAGAGESGLVTRDPGRSSPGYTLLTAIPLSRALLIDTEGVERHAWHNPESIEWERAVLGPDGDLLVVGRRNLSFVREERKRTRSDSETTWIANTRGRYLARYGFDGELRWLHPLPVHHDVEWLPDGRILALGDAPRSEGDFRFMDTSLLVLSAEGEVERQVSLYEVLAASPELFQLELATPHNAVFPDGTVDLFHSNSLERMPFPELATQGPLYAPENVLVSIRHQNLIAILDLERAHLVWCWGPGEILSQHEASWLPSGNILMFDNGNDRGYSRIVEVDPRTNAVTWSYTAPVPTEFFSNGRGTSQALPNGNVLVADTNSGVAFEVTRGGEVVWRFVLRDEEGRLIPLRAERYDTARVEALLVGK
jgi:hypothetical protein